jgi:cyclophilin family peptidyl-prolyl cis-trans isomerase
MNSIKYILLNIFLLTTLLACGQKDQVIKIHRPYGIYAGFNTNKGSISVLLYYKKAPMTVANFIGLAEGTLTNATYPLGIPFYKGSIWHRVVKGHVVQGGELATVKDPANSEVNSTGYEIPNEISDLSHNKAGEKRLLVVPPDLAYEINSGFYGKEIPGKKMFVISPGETLILEVTLIKFKP